MSPGHVMSYTHTHTHTHKRLAPHNDGLSWMESWEELLKVLKQKLQKRQWLQDYIGLFGTDSCPNTMAKYGSEKPAFSTNSLFWMCALVLLYNLPVTETVNWISHWNILKSTWIKPKKAWSFPGGSLVKNPPANAGDMGSIPDPGWSHMPQSN